MRHHIFGKKLNRDIKERKALFRSLIMSLITFGKIRTTLAKAKAIQGLVDKLVTHAKSRSASSLAGISSVLPRKKVIDRLKDEVAPKFTDRKGGFTRIRRVGQRIGDGCEEVFLEWVESEEKEKDKKIKDKRKKGN